MSVTLMTCTIDFREKVVLLRGRCMAEPSMDDGRTTHCLLYSAFVMDKLSIADWPRDKTITIPETTASISSVILLSLCIHKLVAVRQRLAHCLGKIHRDLEYLRVSRSLLTKDTLTVWDILLWSLCYRCIRCHDTCKALKGRWQSQGQCKNARRDMYHARKRRRESSIMFKRKEPWAIPLA